MARRRASCLGPRAEVSEPWAVLIDLLDVLRRRLHMDLAWLGRLEGDLLVLQVVSGAGAHDSDVAVRVQHALMADQESRRLRRECVPSCSCLTVHMRCG